MRDESSYPWRLEEVARSSDHRTPPSPSAPTNDEIARALAGAGYGKSLVDFIGPLLERFGASSFMGGALRLHPFRGAEAHGLPNLVDWNHADGWKEYGPTTRDPTFYFLSNSFGELLGVPMTPEGEIARDRIAILFPDQRLYREAGLAWSDFFQTVAAREDLAGFFAKLPQHAWARAQLGTAVEDWQCFSYKVPPALGGAPSADNLMIVGLQVHVSFSLQLLKQHQEGTLTPGAPLPMVDLYDPSGKLRRN